MVLCHIGSNATRPAIAVLPRPPQPAAAAVPCFRLHATPLSDMPLPSRRFLLAVAARLPNRTNHPNRTVAPPRRRRAVPLPVVASPAAAPPQVIAAPRLRLAAMVLFPLLLTTTGEGRTEGEGEGPQQIEALSPRQSPAGYIAPYTSPSLRFSTCLFAGSLHKTLQPQTSRHWPIKATIYTHGRLNSQVPAMESYLTPPPSSACFLPAALCFVVTILLLWRWSNNDPRRKYNLPPGPRPWPVIGNLNLIGHLPHRSFHELSKLHGPLMSLRLGSQPTIVGSSVDAARLMDHLFTMNINVISLMLFSRKYVSNGGAGSSSTTTFEEFKWMVEEFFVLSGALNLGDMIPWLSWLDLHGYRHVVDEHEERRRREGKAFVPKDMVDLLLELSDDINLEPPIERNGVKAFTLNLLVGLPDTSSVTVEWAMSELLRSPGTLAKVTEELDRVIGGERHVTEGDVPNLPYLEDDVATDNGHDIPKGTLVFVNVWTIGRDPAAWGEDAAAFRPERFTGRDVDVKGQDLELLPFGSGRRMCPGVSLGLRAVTVTLANLLHAYTWRLPAGAGELNMEEKYGLSMPRLVPLEAVAEPRLPAHLYAGP
ncbi:hypothetical protein HU200_015997 [Digitaria exilis]|uniref:Cytochrome P450 n=1 Tax=Digitaria exilis TaxID=1010633 RepID=A0A835KHS7_9POAL|nr:hypothetical protein HU200_015997 [Digitaria exilis]